VYLDPDLVWAILPLPYRIDHINVWAIRDGAGWAVVDTGTHTAPAKEAWEALFTGPLQGLPITRVIVTHMHPDHVGLAGWLQRRFGAPLWMTQTEYLTCRVLVSEAGQVMPDAERDFVRQAGWGQAAIEAHALRFGRYGDHIADLPASFHRLIDGQTLSIGDQQWAVCIGHGHSPEHACLYNADKRWLISGDQVLPRISSNVSVHAVQAEADPMAAWFDSAERLLARVPDDVLVLPAHHACFHGLHARLKQLRDDQLAALDKLHDWIEQPRRVVDVFPVLFRKPIAESDASQLGLATGEAVACLNHLIQQGRAQKQMVDGVAWYQRR
jgi:glyoxylase-like metal-dependent hydrolase (beta-lactamase superfamily II)